MSEKRTIVVCPAAELPPGSRKILDTGDGRSIGVFNVHGKYYALRNLCPHAGAELCRGVVTGMNEPSEVGEYRWVRDGEILRCPWHGSRFALEDGYEISVPARLGASLWQQARKTGATPLGIEALGVSRAEKGYIFVGQDTDGETMSHDLGFAGPRTKRQDAYVGDRSLFTPAANRPDRKRLVGLLVDDAIPIPTGCEPERSHRCITGERCPEYAV